MLPSFFTKCNRTNYFQKGPVLSLLSTEYFPRCPERRQDVSGKHVLLGQQWYWRLFMSCSIMTSDLYWHTEAFRALGGVLGWTVEENLLGRLSTLPGVDQGSKWGTLETQNLRRGSGTLSNLIDVRDFVLLFGIFKLTSCCQEGSSEIP